MLWNPWRGCHKLSEGCKNCYIHKGDAKRGLDTNVITRSNNFDVPLKRLKNGEYRIKSGSLVYLCFSSDFLLSDADIFRKECLEMIRIRSDVMFLFLTKRIDRYSICFSGYEDLDNIIVGCTIEDQNTADYRLSIFSNLNIKHKNIICQPLLESINIARYLEGVELVVVGGESDINARPLNYDWVLNIREQCIKSNVSFDFRQCGTYTIKDGITYKINTRQLMSQARKANINYDASIAVKTENNVL